MYIVFIFYFIVRMQDTRNYLPELIKTNENDSIVSLGNITVIDEEGNETEVEAKAQTDVYSNERIIFLSLLQVFITLLSAKRCIFYLTVFDPFF